MIFDAILAIISIFTMFVLIRQFRGNNNINKNNYLLTMNKCFDEHGDMQLIYNILSDNAEFPVMCDFNKIESHQLSAYLTFLESFKLLIEKGGIVNAQELFNLFGHRIFSILHNKQIQCIEIKPYERHYENLFILHEVLFTYCIKSKKTSIPGIINAAYFIDNGHFIKDVRRYGKGYKKYRKEIEAVMDEAKRIYEPQRIGGMGDFSLDMRIKSKKYEIGGCFFRHCTVDDHPMITKIQEKVVDYLQINQSNDLFIPTESEAIKRLLEREDVFFICVQTPDGICAYSCALFGDSHDYSLSRHFTDKKVATFDTVVVLPAFRGNKLQKKLQDITEGEAKRKGYDSIAATVSPDNVHSRNNFIHNGYAELKTIVYTEQGKELTRLVVYKDL